MDSAPDGVILFALGTMFSSRVVPRDHVEKLFNVFAKLPQRVIFKFDPTVDLSDITPPNVMVTSFLPQQAILKHPNTILFYTHFGMKSVLESIYYGVPMVGTPIIYDMGDICVRVESKGIGKCVPKFASEDEVYDAIVTVRDDKR